VIGIVFEGFFMIPLDETFVLKVDECTWHIEHTSKKSHSNPWFSPNCL